MAGYGIWNENTAHSVYRAYGSDDRLLYVGCTARPLNRLHTQSQSEWWQHAAYMTFEHFDTRSVALEAERVAIEDEDPLYNLRRPGWSAVTAAERKVQARARVDAYHAERSAS